MFKRRNNNRQQELFSGETMGTMPTQFHDIREFKDMLMSNEWNTLENINRFCATFPGMQEAVAGAIRDGSFHNRTSYVNKVAKMTESSFENKLVALYSAFKSGAFTKAFQRTLLDLGMPYKEMADAWQLSEAVDKCLVSTKEVLPYIKDDHYMKTVFGFKYIQAYELGSTKDIFAIDDKLEDTGFYMRLRDLGIDVTDKNTLMNRTFIQHGNTSEAPIQGIKLHISATDKTDYMKMLNNVLPDLIADGACFKVLRMDSFDRLYENAIQAGKAITIYQTPSFDARSFFQKHPELFEQDGHHIMGDCNFGGRVYGRYGAFRGDTVTDHATGERWMNDRTRPYPNFMDGISLNDFIEGCEQQRSGIEYHQNMVQHQDAMYEGQYVDTAYAEYEYEVAE